MALPSVFDHQVNEKIIDRISQLTPDTQAKWDTMNVAQMLAHVNVAYDLAYGRIEHRPNFLMKFFLKSFVKSIVTNEKPYKPNSRTAPVFVVADQRDFDREKAKLIEAIRETEEKGKAHFEGLESVSFGKLTATEWSNQFYKHLDHHLKQFGV